MITLGSFPKLLGGGGLNRKKMSGGLGSSFKFSTGGGGLRRPPFSARHRPLANDSSFPKPQAFQTPDSGQAF